MEQRQGNIIIHASGGTSGKGAQTYKLALPSSWAQQIGMTGRERSVGLEEYDPLEIIRKTEGRMAEDQQWIRVEVLK